MVQVRLNFEVFNFACNNNNNDVSTSWVIRSNWNFYIAWQRAKWAKKCVPSGENLHFQVVWKKMFSAVIHARMLSFSHFRLYTSDKISIRLFDNFDHVASYHWEPKKLYLRLLMMVSSRGWRSIINWFCKSLGNS